MVGEDHVGYIDVRVVDIHRKDVGLVGHILAVDLIEQGNVVVVGPGCIGFGTGLVVDGILNRLESFESGAPQLDFAGRVQVVEECFGGLMHLRFVGFSPQLCWAGYTLGVGGIFDMFECPHSIVVQTAFDSWVAPWIGIQQVDVQ